VTEKTTAAHPEGRTIEWGAGNGATTEFERLSRANMDAVTAYFARRAADPQVVADLTAGVSIGGSAGRSVTVNAKGIPAGDILVVAVETTTTGNTTTSLGAGKLTTAPAPSCVSLSSAAGSDFGWGSGSAGQATGSGGAGKS
jgi:hypothetical protein